MGGASEGTREGGGAEEALVRPASERCFIDSWKLREREGTFEDIMVCAPYRVHYMSQHVLNACTI